MMDQQRKIAGTIGAKVIAMAAPLLPMPLAKMCIRDRPHPAQRPQRIIAGGVNGDGNAGAGDQQAGNQIGAVILDHLSLPSGPAGMALQPPPAGLLRP